MNDVHRRGVFGDEDELKYMMEGESFTLNSDLTEIKDDDVIQWRFGYYEETLIAEINKRTDRIAVYDDVLDGRFRDRLKLNIRSASLTIINITEETGDYSLQINGVRKRKISIGIYVSVKEGESFSLNSDLTEIKDYEWIQWSSSACSCHQQRLFFITITITTIITTTTPTIITTTITIITTIITISSQSHQ
ncbi:unnamed protein product [Leuciscus chuanchicus]